MSLVLLTAVIIVEFLYILSLRRYFLTCWLPPCQAIAIAPVGLLPQMPLALVPSQLQADVGDGAALDTFSVFATAPSTVAITEIWAPGVASIRKAHSTQLRKQYLLVPGPMDWPWELSSANEVRHFSKYSGYVPCLISYTLRMVAFPFPRRFPPG